MNTNVENSLQIKTVKQTVDLIHNKLQFTNSWATTGMSSNDRAEFCSVDEGFW